MIITSSHLEKSHIVFTATGLSITSFSHVDMLVKLVSGKTKQQAIHTLLDRPEVGQVSIDWDSSSPLPNNIHVILLT